MGSVALECVGDPYSEDPARTLGLSRGLVQECYAQLQAEGYLVTRPARRPGWRPEPQSRSRPPGRRPRTRA
ncbi:hypothetical protein GCM10009760_43790 [Kitasatospora kazusensis]|uniref:Uncharacterized protein n=1 Tax=Kitasatospora kazusensis TaxID=407974 RepID=A0ABN2ZZL0_9ACTN